MFSHYNINYLLRSPHIKKYKNIIINTFSSGIIKDFFYNIDLFRLQPIGMIHHSTYYNINNDYCKTNKIISLVKMHCINRKLPYIVNSHYFGEFVKKYEKSKTTIFLAFNSKNLEFRNMYILFCACDKLYEKGINNFLIKIIGSGISIPEKYKNNFQNFGFLDYLSMYKEIHESDFILSLIDQASTFYVNKASGSYQLSYGFLKPILLHKKFSEVSGFNDQNSILYNNNEDLAASMEECINMSNNNYVSLVSLLENTQKELYNLSLNNLKEVLETPIQFVSRDK